jgi:hypothetical protein
LTDNKLSQLKGYISYEQIFKKRNCYEEIRVGSLRKNQKKDEKRKNDFFQSKSIKKESAPGWARTTSLPVNSRTR